MSGMKYRRADRILLLFSCLPADVVPFGGICIVTAVSMARHLPSAECGTAGLLRSVGGGPGC